ncbi:hypothetical protein [Salinithrix halophila]|uniref:Uncharacterized protein n=1 Tax=Salinithrix halophila TaxID=1485204 RepID=A0ABV8JB40_9BACL
MTPKTVYPENFTELQIDDMGELALNQFKQNKKFPYKEVDGVVTPVKFSSIVKGPNGKIIEVEGFVVPKSADYITTHYPKFDSNSNRIKKEK